MDAVSLVQLTDIVFAAPLVPNVQWRRTQYAGGPADARPVTPNSSRGFRQSAALLLGHPLWASRGEPGLVGDDGRSTIVGARERFEYFSSLK